MTAVTVLALALAFLFMGCDSMEPGKAGPNAVGQNPPNCDPREYLPSKPGTTWTYDIKVGKAEPLNYEEVLWNQGDGKIVMASRGRFWGFLNNKAKEDFRLKMRVKGPAAKQGGMQYPIGIELEILEDGLGVFKHEKQVFWAATVSGGLMAHQVVTHGPDSSGAPSGGPWGSWGAEDGYSMEIFLFGKKPGTEVSMRETDSLLFIGNDAVPGQNTSGLHFLRTVKPAKKESGEVKKLIEEKSEGMNPLGKGFTEDKWFVRGRGLVRLEQRVDGVVSMTWVLKEFSGN